MEGSFLDAYSQSGFANAAPDRHRERGNSRTAGGTRDLTRRILGRGTAHDHRAINVPLPPVSSGTPRSPVSPPERPRHQPTGPLGQERQRLGAGQGCLAGRGCRVGEQVPGIGAARGDNDEIEVGALAGSATKPPERERGQLDASSARVLTARIRVTCLVRRTRADKGAHGDCSRWSRRCGGGPVKPSAQPTLVRTQHLPPPAKTPR